MATQTQTKNKAAEIVTARINGETAEATEAAAAEAAAPLPRPMIIKEIPIKGPGPAGPKIYHVKRDRVALTPSMCKVQGCGYDAATKKYPEGWEAVPESDRENCLKALAQHHVDAHTLSQAWIVDESDIPKQWLGEHR